MNEDFLKEIQDCITNNETGRLEIRNLKNQQDNPWSIYFALGRFIWANGGKHSGKRVYRQLKKHAPALLKSKLEISQDFNWQSPSANYDLLAELFHRENMEMKQLSNIHNEITLEVLFDIFQTFDLQNQAGSEYGENSGLQWEWFSKIRPEQYTPVPPELDISSETLLQKAQQQWKKWQQANLSQCLPNQAPVMKDAEKIRQATAAKTFNNLKRLLTGKRTLRDIAVDTKRDVLAVTQALWGYYQKGWLAFQEVPDFDLATLVRQPSKSTPTASVTPSTPEASATPHKKNKFLVACVDDSPQVTQTMEQILQENGYECISINDPLRASATLLKAKPDLIFLDLIMPNTNGYEICSQLRRVSSLQEVPIIILTGKDGFIDRMRAKMVGSTYYLSKPVERNAILETVHKYLPNNSSTQSEFSSNISSAQA